MDIKEIKKEYLDSFCKNCQAYIDGRGNCPLFEKRTEKCYDVMIADEAFDVGYSIGVKENEKGN